MEHFPSQHGLQFESEPGAYHGDANDELAKPSPNPRDSSSGLVTSVVGGGTWVLWRKGFCSVRFFLACSWRHNFSQLHFFRGYFDDFLFLLC